MASPPSPPPQPLVIYPLNRAPKWRRGSIGSRRPVDGAPTHHHAGVDIDADYGETVFAMLPGRLVKTQTWAGGETAAMLVEGDGATIVYGAVLPESWSLMGLSEGDTVEAGQAIAQIGKYPRRGDTMLHIEAWAPGIRRTKRWPWMGAPPRELRDVRVYLDAAEPVGDHVTSLPSTSRPAPQCDPLVGDCPAGAGCFPSSGGGFTCAPLGAMTPIGAVEVEPDDDELDELDDLDHQVELADDDDDDDDDEPDKGHGQLIMGGISLGLALLALR